MEEACLKAEQFADYDLPTAAYPESVVIKVEGDGVDDEPEEDGVYHVDDTKLDDGEDEEVAEPASHAADELRARPVVTM